MVEAISALREPLIDGNKTLAQITEDVCEPLEGKPTHLWWSAFLASSAVLLLGVIAVTYQLWTGIGTWG